MFFAYSDVLKRTVDISEAYDLEEIYSCPNIKCEAKFKIKSPTGKPAKHFAKLGSTEHMTNCPYDLKDNYNQETNNIIKYSLEEILNDNTVDTSVKREHKTIKASVSNESSEKTTKYVRTTKALVNFCLQNELSTEYLDGQTINDILVDDRNVALNRKAKGVNGIRLIIGKTVRFQKSFENCYIEVQIFSNQKPDVHLNCKVYMDENQLTEIVKYILKTFSQFKNYPIAVFSNWKIDKDFHISTRVQSEKQIVIKFK